MQTLAAARAKFVKLVKFAKIARPGRRRCRRPGRPEVETARGGLLLIDHPPARLSPGQAAREVYDSHGGL